MDRKQFLQSGCGCAALAVISQEPVAAQESQTAEQVQKRLDSTLRRVAMLLNGIDSALDEPAKRRLFEAVGRSCAREFGGKIFDQYRGDLDGFRQEILKRWGERTEYDAEQDVVSQTSPERAACFCPLARDLPNANPVLCHCSVGFNKEAYESVTGRKADVKFEETNLLGASHCRMTIRLL